MPLIGRGWLANWGPLIGVRESGFTNLGFANSDLRIGGGLSLIRERGGGGAALIGLCQLGSTNWGSLIGMRDLGITNWVSLKRIRELGIANSNPRIRIR